MQEAGAGEILLTSMDQDGTKQGFDIALTKAMSDALEIPIIASGGVGAVSHFVDGALDGGADALLAASVFHYGEMSVSEVKKAMSKAGIEVRL
jgi:cyclase